MAKTSGLGDNLYAAGYDLSGDIGSLSTIGAPMKPLELTAIDKLAFERVPGQRDGKISFTSFFNPSISQEHTAFSALPTADVLCTYARGAVLGNPAAVMIAKQLNYDGKRTNEGNLTFDIDMVGQGFGLEWGLQLTPGVKTDVAATNGTGVDTTASLAFGAQAYLQGMAFAGTDVTVKVQDSADNISFADVTGLTFTQITTSRFTQRLATANTATIRRYLRAITVTTGGFTSLAYSVVVVKNQAAGVVF